MMKNKNITIAVIVLAIVAVGVGAMYLYNNQKTPLQNSTNTTYNPKTQGKLVFGITDAAADLNGVSSVFITVNKIEIHSAANGWVTVLNTAKQYDLLALKQSGAVSLLANTDVNAGTYDQVRLMVTKVVVVKNGVSQEAKLPSGELKVFRNTVVGANKTLSVVFDVMVDKSLHATGSGKFIFAPVLEIRRQDNVNVTLTSNNEITITGGSREADEKVGMDEKGEVKSNFELNGNLNIDGSGNIQLGGIVEGNVGTSDKLIFNFAAQNNSGVYGTATLSQQDGKVKVTLELNGGDLGLVSLAKPAHIHVGSCANIGAVKYPLNSVENGKSETMINISLASLKAQFPLALNVHKSATEINTYIACTDLKN